MEYTKQEQKLKENKEEEQELITDFSTMFKGKGAPKRMPKLSNKQAEPTPNWLLEIPTKLEITKQELCQRKVFDQRRWHSISKTSQEKLQVTSAVVSVWNYLYSEKGVGKLSSLTVKKAVQLLEKQKIHCEQTDIIARDKLALTCFDILCKIFKVKGQGKVIFKPVHPNKLEVSDKQGCNTLLQGLKKQSKAYILLTTDKVLCPIGFEQTPLIPIDAYKKLQDINPEKLQLWIMTGTLMRMAPSFVLKRWKHIKQSLQTLWPNYLNLDQAKNGPVRHPQATIHNQSNDRGNSGCLIEFER